MWPMRTAEELALLSVFSRGILSRSEMKLSGVSFGPALQTERGNSFSSTLRKM